MYLENQAGFAIVYIRRHQEHMPYLRKSLPWYFVRSVFLVALLLLPFLYVGRFTLHGRLTFASIDSLVTTIFAPAHVIFGILCKSLEYCVEVYYSGASLVFAYYILSVLLYGYALSLIWSWTSFPKYRKQPPEYYEG